MLISFSVANFLSFKEEVDLRMVASLERIHPHHVLRTTSRHHPNLLRMAAIYGANASGKSNLVKAIQFVQDLVVDGMDPDARIPIQRFRLDTACLQEPSRFKIEFRTNNTNYAYTLAVDPERVWHEELNIVTNTTENLIFSRKTSIRGEVQIDFGTFSTRLSEKERQFLEFVALGTRPNQLFVHETIERNIDRFRPVFNWFRRTLQIIVPDSRYNYLEIRLDTDQSFKEFLGRVLKAAGTGISDVKTEETSLETVTGVPEELLRDVREQISDNEFAFIQGSSGRRFVLTKHDDELRVSKLITIRKVRNGSSEAAFEVHEESDGTQRLFDLVPMLYDLTVGKSKRVYVVDEITRNLHPHLTNLIVDTHLDLPGSDKQSQLIITTHETNLLDLDRLRRDELWFTEKREDGSTDLYSLSDFQPRYDKDVRRDYLFGRYGAIPFIGNIQPLRLPPTNIASDIVQNSEEINAS